MTDNHILLVDCPDEKGLIHRVTQVLYRFGLNVEDQEEFVQKEDEYFYLRTEFSGAADLPALAAELSRCLPASARVELAQRAPKRIVIIAGTEPHCLGDLLVRQELGELNAQVLGVISNHTNVQKLTERFEIPFHHVSHENQSRTEHEAGITRVLSQYQPEYLVLAKYMRILSAEFVERHQNRIINIHHSFLPAFAGARPYHQAYQRGVKIIGATAHFVSAELDQGPIVAQDVVSVRHGMTAEDMVRAGRDVERAVLSKALRLVFEDRVFVHKNRTIVFE